MNKKLRPICGTAVLLSVVVAIVIYAFYASDTRVAFVNWPEYMLAPLMDQDLSPFIHVDALPWMEKSGRELNSYNAIIFFGMGLDFTEEQQQMLSRLKVPYLVTASTRQETALCTYTEAQRERIAAYLNGGGKENFRNLLAYLRREVDGKRIGAPIPKAPKEAATSVFFHTQEEPGFDTYSAYLEHYRAQGKNDSAHPTVALLNVNGGGDLDTLVAGLEAKGINVVGINGFGRFQPLIEEVKPDMLIYMPHGRLGMGQDPEQTLAMLRNLNIPLVCPVKVNQEYRSWLKDQRSMTGGMLSQSITMPELDGGIVPYALSALEPNRRGLLDFRIRPDRLEHFCTLVHNMLILKKLDNSQKKVAIVYYKAPGRNALEGGGLEVGQSILNTLRHLQAQGYTTGPLPETAEALNRQIQENGAVFGAYAEGAVEEFLAHAHVERVTRADYEAWAAKAMPADLYEEVVGRYGPFPGKTPFAAPEGDALLMPMVRFGNIVLLPQGLPGGGESEDRLVHGLKMAPPHTYIATYLWIRYGFGANALLHFGTHGSLEFTPWKQVALSSYDWPDVLVGDVPHYYLYVCNNIGEAQIAKRRSYATMLSHLTAPFMTADGYGDLEALDEKLHHYKTAENALLKAEYAKSIVEIARRNKYDVDLTLSGDFAKGVLNDDDFLRLHNFVHEIENAKVARGEYVIGRPYTQEQATETATLMMLDTFAEEAFKADEKAGRVTAAQREDAAWYEANYLSPARARIAAVFAHPEEYQAKATEAEPAPAEAPRPPAGMGASPEEMRKMLASGTLPDGRPIPPAMKAAMKTMAQGADGAKGMPATPTLEAQLLQARQALLDSTQAELAAIGNAFDGGYISPASGGDPIGNPAVVPTGRNMYGIDPERTPTRESYAVGQQLAQALIEAKLKTTGAYPQKVAFTLWGGEFIRTQGANLAEILALLGVEPVWDSRGRVTDVRLVPMADLKRPRIDVVVQTSGQFRGAATSRMRLIDKAVRLAAEDTEASEFANYVLAGSVEVAKALIAAGMPAEQARAYANARLFGGVNGNFGTGVQGMVQDSARWDETKGIADLYISNMGALYTDEHWGEFVPGAFRGALAHTDTVVQSLSSNSWGPLSLDHVYEFTGGISLAARHVTGQEPQAYFNDLRTPGRPKVRDAGEAVMVEARATALNPKYIGEMMKEGPSAAQHFTEFLHNTFGWETMKPDLVKEHLWEEFKDVYVNDSLELGVRDFFEAQNPYALEDMTAVMLEAARKGMWAPDEATVRQLAELHAELVERHGPGCSGFVCNNPKLKEMIAEKLSDESAAETYRAAIERVRTASAARATAENLKGQVLKEETLELTPEQRRARNRRALWLLGGVLALAIAFVLLGSGRKRQA